MHKDAKSLIPRCKTCQIHSSIPRKPKKEITSIMSAWPFSQWGIDIVEPLPMASGSARIKKYFQIQDYALWDVIKNGNSFVPVTQTITAKGCAITITISSPVTAEKKIKKKNDVKARSMLLMVLPNEHLMTFNQYKDAKSLVTAIETRYGGNEARKKTLLKQCMRTLVLQAESLESIFNRLQKIVSQLAVFGVAMPTDPHYTPTILQPSSQPQKKQTPRKPTRKDTQVPQPSDPTDNVVDEAVHKELGTNSGGGPGCQETMRDTTAQTRVLELEKTKTTQHNEIASLKRRVKKLEKRNRSRTHKLKRLYKVGLTARVESPDDEESLEVVDAAQVSTAVTTVTITIKEITLAQALKELKTLKPKSKGIVIQELGESTTTISKQQSQDKGKGIMIEEPVKPKKNDQIRLDEEATKKQRLMLIIIWLKDCKHKNKKSCLMQKRLHYFNNSYRKRKHFAAKRAEEKRNKPPTQVQQRKIMCTYLKNMEGYKLKDLNLKGFESIKEMFNKAFRRVNTFKDFRIELVKGKEKRAGEELIQESTKKQKVEDDKETTELK
nr:rve domain-containing protein [Tanacetum cinerariifolium]